LPSRALYANAKAALAETLRDDEPEVLGIVVHNQLVAFERVHDGLDRSV
jgi:hypothetical protein